MSPKTPRPPQLDVEDDELYTPKVGDWSEHKYRLLWYYADLFATSMKYKWDKRCYIDLFAGSGHARIRGTSRIVKSSSLLAVQVTDPFDCYVFCDSNSDCSVALKKRVAKLNPSAQCQFLDCDINKSYNDVISRLPPHGKSCKVLSFCFIDPFKLRDIKFKTIRNLSNLLIDYLILIPRMDPARNEKRYYAASSKIVSGYLGNEAWRDMRRRGDPALPFDLFIARALDGQMKSLGYNYGGILENVMIRSTKKNLLLYSLAFYSRRELGEKFWRVTKKMSDPQLSLFR